MRPGAASTCVFALVFVVGGETVALGAPQEREPPRQQVHARNPVRTDTTFLFRFERTSSTLEWDGGKATLTALQLPAGEREYATVESLTPGEVLRLERSAVIKLTTDAALDFGSASLPVENVAPGYAGVYGLWIQRTAEGWTLVFNDEADAWGTQHDAAFDRAWITAHHELRSGESGPLSAAIEGTPDSAVLLLSWGEHVWSAPFRVASVGTGAAAARSARDWPHYGGDLGASRYSELDEIRAENFGSLEVAWRWTTADEEIRREHPELRALRHEAVPLAIDGKLYAVTSLSQLAAIDAGSGRQLWVYDPASWRAGPPTNFGFMQRGAAHWREPATGAARLLYATGDSWLVAVDAESGRAIESFGDGGRVDLIPRIPLARRPEPGRGRGNYTVNSPPVIVGDVVIVGSSIADRPNTIAMPRGDIQGFDVRTGAHLWTFHVVPQARELGNDTWEDGSWREVGNANVWTTMSGDEELGLVYLPFSTPTSDYYGGHRKGAGLFAESLVALEAATGRRVWHFQMVHHGLWDYDLPAAANVVDIEVDGRLVPAVAQISKQGFTYVFDRRTGEPVWPIEERPVPASSVPGEEAWKTQPFPTRPPPFERQGSTVDNLIDFTPELRAEAVEILESFDHGPLFTPPSERGTLQLPGSGGGGNWGGAAFDPGSGVLFVGSITAPIVASVSHGDPERTEFEWVGAREFGYGLQEPLGPRGLPLFKPPYARVTAIDLGHGEILWQSPVGQGPRHLVEKLTGSDPGPLGASTGTVHVLATKTLVLAAKSGDRSGAEPGGLWAFSKEDGREVGFAALDGQLHGSPITYQQAGRQHVVIAVTRPDGVQELVALALPGEVVSEESS